jgi:ATP-binding cassette subfamily C protein CydC
MRYWFDLLIKSQGSRLYWGVLWVVITTISGVSLLMLSGWFITATSLAGIAISAGIVLMFDMYMPGSGIRFFALSRTVGRYTERVYNHDTVLRLIAKFRVSTFEQLTCVPMSELRASSDSEWLGKLTADLDALDSILLRYTIAPLAAVITILLISGFLSFIWLELALCLGIFFLVLYIFNISLTITQTKTLASASSQMLSTLRADIIEHLKGAFELQSYQLMQDHEQPILMRLEKLGDVQQRFNGRVANIQLVLDLSLAVALSLLIFVVLYAVHSNHINGPIAVLWVMMFIGMSEILQSVPSQISSWGKTDFAANRLKEMIKPQHSLANQVEIKKLDELSVHLEHEAKIPITGTKPLIFKLQQSQLLLVLGRSGSGKSSLANLLTGLETDTHHGSNIIINDAHKLQLISSESWCSHLGYLEQSNSLLAGTLAYNLMVGLPDLPESQLWSVLKLVELEQWARALPKGLNTWLGEAGGSVSGGQARRICLARLLLRAPDFVVLDEPFNGVDAQMAARIWQNISPWIASKMVILLMHEQAAYISDAVSKRAVTLDVNGSDLSNCNSQ